MTGEREERAERMKRHVGQAPPGTTEYFRNAAKVLSQWVTPGGTLREDTQEKLRDLARSGDAETRRIAQEALQGHAYESDDDSDDSDDD